MSMFSDDRWRENPTYRNIPERTMNAMVDYVEIGCPPGDFLKAVICNNLKDSLCYADDDNSTQLKQIVMWFYNEAPALCWGTEAKLKKWMDERKKERENGTSRPSE